MHLSGMATIEIPADLRFVLIDILSFVSHPLAGK